MENIINKHGIECFGICPFDAVKDSLIECRAKSRLPENSKSIICMLFPYYLDIKERNISRYAIVRDYHLVVGEILDSISKNLKEKYPDYNFEYFCDNSPIPEKKTAALAGLGVIGDNTLLINAKYGSWVFIGEIVTDMPISYNSCKIEHCMHCGKCKEECPTGALSLDKFDRNLCLSSITQKKKDLSEKEQQLIRSSGCAWGCDICQECCPLNKKAEKTNIVAFLKDIHSKINIGDYDNLTDRAFAWRGKKVIERNISILDHDNDNNNS